VRIVDLICEKVFEAFWLWRNVVRREKVLKMEVVRGGSCGGDRG
jgi:hypothetical protein